MFLQNRASFPKTRALDRRRWPVAPNSHPVDRRPFVGRNSASASRSPPRRSASSMSRFWSSPFSSRGCPGTAPLCAARCPASLVKVVGARRQAFARSLAGRRRQGRRWLEWLPMACRQGSAAARRGRAARSSARRVFSHVQRSTRSGSAWDCAILRCRTVPTPGHCLECVAHAGVRPALGDQSEGCVCAFEA